MEDKSQKFNHLEFLYGGLNVTEISISKDLYKITYLKRTQNI